MHWFEIVDREFFRVNFQKIYKECKKKPIVISCKYKHTDNEDWYTFVKIRPYTILKTTDDNNKIFEFCNHINIKKSDIDNFIILTKIIIINNL